MSAGNTTPAFVSRAVDLTTGDVSGPASATPGNLAEFANATGKLLADSGVKSQHIHDGSAAEGPSVNRGNALFVPLAGGTYNDYAPAGLANADFLFVSPSGNVDITGIDSSGAIKLLMVANAQTGPLTVTLKLNDAGSLPANRIDTGTASDLVLYQGEAAWLIKIVGTGWILFQTLTGYQAGNAIWCISSDASAKQGFWNPYDIPANTLFGRAAAGLKALTPAEVKAVLAYLHADLGGVGANDHHNQVHDLAGGDHNSATVAAFNAKISDGDFVKLAGQLGGTAALPDVRGIRETGGPTLLTVGAIAAGQFLQRVGATIVGAAAPGAALPYEYLSGYEVSFNTTVLVNIAAGAARNDANDGDIVDATGFTVNIATTGANGRNVDTAEQSDKWYGVYVISDASGSTRAGFLINEDDLGSFTYPPGYSRKRRVGWIRNDGTGNIRKFRACGGGRSRNYIYEDTRASLLALSGGGSTVWSAVDCSEWIPPTQAAAFFNTVMNDNDDEYVEFRPTGSTLANGTGFRGNVEPEPGENAANFCFMTNSSQSIDYRNSSGLSSTDIVVYGWADSP